MRLIDLKVPHVVDRRDANGDPNEGANELTELAIARPNLFENRISGAQASVRECE